MTTAQCNMILGLRITDGYFIMPYYTTWARYITMFNLQSLTPFGIRIGL
jgi:hypothetical protein